MMLEKRKKIVLTRENRIVGEVIILVERDMEITIIEDKDDLSGDPVDQGVNEGMATE